MAIQSRPPIVALSAVDGEYDVLANHTTVLWHRMLHIFNRKSVPKIACFIVEATDAERAQWRVIDQWAADLLCGWLTGRRSAEMRRGMRGTQMGGRALRDSLRAELAPLLRKDS